MFPPIRLIFCGGALALALSGQDDAPLKARELFYKPLSPTPANHAPAPPKPAARKAPARKPTSDAITETNAPKPSPSQPNQNSVLIKADYAPRPLALKYTIAKQTGGRFADVDPESEFHSGDHIRVNVEANDAAYLYIVMQGSSGTWQLLFPDAAISGGNNRIEPGKPYSIPSGESSFYFDEKSGTEKVTLILTRTPEQDLEKLIYSTGERNAGNDSGKVMLAQNRNISDAVMGQVQQQMLSRDLVFEKAETSEKAMYVATPNSKTDARVFVDLKLIHK